MQRQENQVKKISFEGEQIFVGIDVHKKSWKVSLYHQDTALKVFSQDPDTEQLVDYLSKHYPGADFRCAYEAGFSGFGLQRELTAHGINCMVVNPADVPTSHKEKEFKSDKRDCRKIAKALRSELLEGIYVPTEQGEEFRKVVRLFHDMSRQYTRSKNKVKSMLDFHGIGYPEEFYQATTHWTERFFQWLKSLRLTSEQGTWTLQWYVDECLRSKEQKRIARKKVTELSKTKLYSENVELLRSLPGIGLITAMTILTEIEDISRFKNLDKLCSYIGLIPSTNSSGEKEIIGDMTHRGNKYLRHVIIESSWIAIQKDPSLFKAYLRVKNDRVTNKGIIKVARKLVSRILYVLVNQTPYQIRMEE